MENNQNCQPPSLNTSKQYIADLNLKMVGAVKSVKDDVLEISYQGSNKFWDESDVFSLQGETVLLYRSPSNANVKAGDKVIAHITGMYWDTTHERNVGACTWVMRVLSSSKVEPYTFDPSIAIVEGLQSYFPFILLITAAVTITALFKLKKKKIHS